MTRGAPAPRLPGYSISARTPTILRPTSPNRDPAASGEALAAGVGRSVRLFVVRLGSVAQLGWRCLVQAFRLRRGQRAVIAGLARSQVRFTALEALPLVLLTALLSGSVLLLETLGQLSSVVSEATLCRLVALLVVREIGPLLVAILVIARSGTAIAAEMAASKIDREVDTLWAIGVDPVSYLLLPRLVGVVLSVFTLVVLFDAVALFGGYFVASLPHPFSFRIFRGALDAALGPRELLGTLLKSLAFGGVIPLVCALAGLRTRASSTEIPQAVTRAAVESLGAVFLLGAVVSLLIYG